MDMSGIAEPNSQVASHYKMSCCSVEKPIHFYCNGKKLYGILHLPKNKNALDIVILMVVGGPQTRIGSHRLYVQLGRALCVSGVTVLRFDYEGLGDSEGNFVGFRVAGPSIRSAIDFLCEYLPNIKNLVLWSLCDGATACAIYAQKDRDRIAAMILCNPYVETEESQAKTFLKYYYIRRIVQREFWSKILFLNLDIKDSVISLLGFVKKAYVNSNNEHSGDCVDRNVNLPDQMVNGMIKFNKPIRFLLSKNDLTAMEFRDVIRNRKELTAMMQSNTIAIKYMAGADHTFSNKKSKQLLLQQVLSELKELDIFERLEIISE